MPFYCVWAKEGTGPDMYWVQANTEQQARALSCDKRARRGCRHQC